MMLNTKKQMRPTIRSTVQRNTGLTTLVGMNANISEFATAGDMVKIANTPIRAIAISRPIAIAISLPLNHLAIARDTVIPAISQPQPKIMKPKHAKRAVPGRSINCQLVSVASSSEPTNQSLTA